MQDFLWKRFEEFRRQAELPFRQPDRALIFPWKLKGFNFRNRHVTLAQQDGLPARNSLEIAGEMGFCFMDVQLKHGLILN